MSRLKVDNIETRSGNNVAMDNALQLKSYNTAGRDALTASAGDMIYNSQTGTIDFYNGSAWYATSDSTFIFDVSYLIIAGGGGGGGNGPFGPSGGGGAGGYRNSYSTETSGANSSTETPITVVAGNSYSVVVGAGGTYDNNGNDSSFITVTATKGGAGGQTGNGAIGGSGGGGGYNGSGGAGTALQGKNGGSGGGSNPWGGGGGGGASANGGNFSGSTAGAGGAGLSSGITGSSITRAGGGGGSTQNGTAGAGGAGGGGAGKPQGQTGISGTAYTGGGGGGGWAGGSGGSGVVILRYPNTYSITLAGGASSTNGEQTDGSDKYIQIESSGTVSWS